MGPILQSIVRLRAAKYQDTQGMGQTPSWKGMRVLKKSITYEDYSGETVTEDFYFNLSRAELIELELSHEGGLSESLKKIISSGDGGKIIEEFKNIILSSYGQKSPDGRRFIKTQQLRDEFMSTEAYSVLFMELVTDPNAAAEFVNGMIPHGLVNEDQMELPAAEEKKTELAVVEEKEGPKKLSTSEIREMDVDELRSGLASGRYEL